MKITTRELKKKTGGPKQQILFRMARAKPFNGKTSENPVKPENSIRLTGG